MQRRAAGQRRHARIAGCDARSLGRQIGIGTAGPDDDPMGIVTRLRGQVERSFEGSARL